jgi:hypothetical protein
VLNLIGAKYIAARGGAQFPEGYFGSKPVTPAKTFGPVQVVRNDNAFPRVYLADRYRVFDDRADIYPLIEAGADSLREVVYLEKEPGIELSPDSLSADSAWIMSYGADSVLVGVSASANKILVLTDNYFDAWHPYVDGKPAELLRAYGSFRAVAVPAGTREVLFRYASSRYQTGKLVTALTSLFVLGILGFYSVRTVRLRKKEEDSR